jgi:hypothetical protein
VTGRQCKHRGVSLNGALGGAIATTLP